MDLLQRVRRLLTPAAPVKVAAAPEPRPVEAPELEGGPVSLRPAALSARGIGTGLPEERQPKVCR